jgi:hypothetical protein
MYTGQLALSGLIGTTDQRGTPNGVAGPGAGEPTFAALIETAMALSEMDCSATGATDDPLGTDEDAGGLLSNFDLGGMGTTNSSAFLGQLLSQSGRTQVLPFANAEPNDSQVIGALRGAALLPTAQQTECPPQSAGPDGSIAPQTSVAGAIDKGELSNWMDAHALTRSSHRCAMYCRMGLEAAGLSTADRPQSGDAGDYGPYLLRHGAHAVAQDSYVPQVGDVVVFDKTSEHPFGHIQTYDGHHWVSDFVQHGMSPYNDANSTPQFTIYRFA